MRELSADTQLNITDYLQIRYARLHFSLELLEDAELPANKGSMLRGCMGEMLLRTSCVKEQECADQGCEYEAECLARRIMYPQMNITPTFMSGKDGVGYVIDCENYRTWFRAGDHLEFTMLLFGKSIVHFGQILQAFMSLGMHGMGMSGARYRIRSLTSANGLPVLDDNNIYMTNLDIQTVADYVDRRWQVAGQADHILFHTPTTIKYQSERIHHLNAEAILAACERRLYILNCYQGNEIGRIDWKEHVPEIDEHRVKEITVYRYSSTHAQFLGGKIPLHGIVGDGALSGVDDMARVLLLAGELMHIGNSTIFGFGRYSLVGSRGL